MIQSIEDGRKEDGNRSIADKIIKRLHDLEKTVENNHGRWAWELLQNAKDSVADSQSTVSVQIILDGDYVEFRHNGAHFSEQDIRGLINQISSKENEAGLQTRKVGKFGTGFLTTHLLSKVIEVAGIVETSVGELYRFAFSLDRDGKTTSQLSPKIETAWGEFHASTEEITTYNKEDFNTCFRYKLHTEEQIRIARIGIEEFSALIPYVLAFNAQIASVSIVKSDFLDKETTTFTCNREFIEPSVLTITKDVDSTEETIYILFSSDEKVSVAMPLEKEENGYSIGRIKDIPKLFCDFPLIGTEGFYFPMIVNSFYFNPLTERDGVWLKNSNDPEVKENQGILTNALSLYTNVLSKVSNENFYSLFNIVNVNIPDTSEKYFDADWYKLNIQKPIKEFTFKSSLVEMELADTPKKAIKDVWFPAKSLSVDVRTKIWQFFFDLFPSVVCRKDHLHSWCDISWDGWNRLDYTELAKDIANYTDIVKLSEALEIDEKSTFDWINNVGAFLLAEETNLPLFEKFAIVSNQNMAFKIKSQIHIDEIKDPQLIEVLALLGDDWKDTLIHRRMAFGRYYVKDKKAIAAAITEKLKKQSSDTNVVKAISLLSEWFENNKEEGKEIFSELYRKRAELFMNTISDKESLYKVMRSKAGITQLSKIADAIEENPQIIDQLDKADELGKFLKKHNVTSISELEELLSSAQNQSNNSNIQITQETLVSLGISSPEEFERIFKNTELYEKFVHNSSSSDAAYQYAQRIIQRAKANIIRFLNTLDEYDCEDCDEIAPSIFAGIKKNGEDIFVVARPSDNGEVIIYYPSEVATLQFAESELWYEDGKDHPKKLTLGQIFKKTGINRIPI